MLYAISFSVINSLLLFLLLSNENLLKEINITPLTPSNPTGDQSMLG